MPDASLSVLDTGLIHAVKARRERLLARLAGRPALIPAGSAAPRNYPHNPYPYRASSHFLYLVGIGIPGALLWLDEGGARLLLPPADPLDALWHGPGLDPAELRAHTGLTLGSTTELAQLARARQVSLLPVLHRSDAVGLARALGRDPNRLGDEAHDAPLIDAMIALRLVHDADAQRQLRRAAAATLAAHRAGMRATLPGLREREIVAAMESVFIREGFCTAYPSIVTVCGEILHDGAHHRIMREGDLLLADVGAESDSGFAADVTRTWPVGGRFSATQRDLYELVLSAQTAALAVVRPAARFRDVHGAAARAIVEGLVALGIFEGEVDGLIERGAHALFFPHGVGHLLGLDVHDMEDLGDRAGYAPGRARASQFGLSYLRLDRDLEVGMAVTIEPGFYQVPALLAAPERVGLDVRGLRRDRLAAFADVRGIRIEDDVLLTDDGHEVLTAELPRSAQAIEEAVGSRAG